MKAYYKGKFYYPKRKKTNAQTKKPTPKKVVGKVGYCDNKTLNMRDKNGNFLQGGHYVYIRAVKGGKCDVNVITSLEDKSGKFEDLKIKKVKAGYLYPIPKEDGSFARWSAINLTGNKKDIPLEKIQGIGQKTFKTRHKFFVGKFTKK